MIYRLKAEFQSLSPDRLTTLMGGERFTLDSKPFSFVVPATKKSPAREVIFPPATQEQLKKLYDMGHGKDGKSLIEEVPGNSSKASNA